MTDAGAGPLRELLGLLIRPERGRLRMSLVVAVGVAIMLVVWETFRIPQTLIACYVVVFMARTDRASTAAGARLMAVASVLAVLLAVLVEVASLSEPALRIALMALISFVAMSLSRAPGRGVLFFAIGFLCFQALTSSDSLAGLSASPAVYGNANTGPPEILFVPPEEALVQSTLWMALAFATPALLLLVLARLFGIAPARLLRGGIDDRLLAVEAWCRGEDGAARRLATLARRGAPELAKLAGLAAKEGGSAEPAGRNEARIHALVRLMLCCLAAEQLRPGAVPPWAAAVEEGCAALRAGRPVVVGEPGGEPGSEPGGDPIGAAAVRQLCVLDRPPEPAGRAGSGTTGPGLLHGADWSWGFKVTLAVMVCYVLNNALDWTQIGTSVTTCFVVALGSVGESGHKMALRVCGCLVGAALGIGTVVLLMPVMTDIGQFALLTGVVVFPSAWIALGSERIAYAGNQLALAYYATVLEDYGPTTDMEGARNRVAGILLGITVSYLVFALVWPVRADRLAAGRLADALAALGRMLRADGGRPAGRPDGRGAAEKEFGGAITAAQALLGSEPFETDPGDGGAATAALAARVQELVIPVEMLASVADPGRDTLAAWLDDAAARMRSGRWAREGLPPPPDLPDGPARRARLLLHRVLARPAGQHG